MNRNYAPLEEAVKTLPASPNRESRMRAFIDALWDALEKTGVSWAGFYLPDQQDGLVLGPSRNKPACSPIGLHGACGRCFLERRPLLVRDVADLGPNYVACDPRDRSELVIPALEPDGDCWGVLDLDSLEVAAYDQRDVEQLHALLIQCGLTAPEIPLPETIVV